MRFIPSFVHGCLDYLVGIALATAPWWLGFSDNAAAVTLCLILGIGAILYSLLTNYELGAIRLIPFPIHLMIDFVSGLFLFISPWIFGFTDKIAGALVTFGLFEMGAAILTRPTVLGFGQLTRTRY